MPSDQPDGFATFDRRTVSERLESMLREAILRGQYAPGEKLPPERELAVRFGVTRVTLRSALARLSAAGLLHTVQGDGHRVRDVRTTSGLDRLPDMIRALESDPEAAAALVADMLALRRVVVAEACAIATGKPKRALRGLFAHVVAMSEAIDDVPRFAAHDQAFTRALLALAGNRAFELTFNTVVSFTEGRDDLVELLYADRTMLVTATSELVRLLEQGEPAAVRELVRSVLETHDAQIVRRVRAMLAKRNETRRG